jgi:hypothetical protein
MSHRIEVGFQVEVDDVGLALQDGFRDPSDRLVR